ncbi:UNVERIFIED_CONTAM: hypothetical protein FKN15_077258 [Acipenser sinensis]
MVPGTYPACAQAPANSLLVPAARQMVPGTSPVCAWAPVTLRCVPAACKWSLEHLHHAHGPQRLHVGSQQLAICPWHITSMPTGPSDHTQVPSGFTNGPWHLPSVRSGPSEFAPGSSGSPNGPWHIPSVCMGPSDFALCASGLQMVAGTSASRARAPASSRGVPAARNLSLAHHQHAHGAQRPHAGSQRLYKWSLAPTQRALRPQRIRSWFQRLAKWSLAPT